MRGQHLVYPVPDKMDEFKDRLNDLGIGGWELIYFRGANAYFMQHGTPINYEIIQNPEYVDDYTTTLNSLGASSWILVQTRNGYSVFKKIAIQ